MDLGRKSREQLEHDYRALQNTHELYKHAHPPQRRDTDAPHEDHTGQRAVGNGGGPGGNGGNGFEIGYKGMGVQARGPLAVLAIVFVLVTGGLGFVGYTHSERIQILLAKANEGHTEMAASSDRMACIVSLSPEEKTRLRLNVTRDSFANFCPWLRYP